jgi:pyrroloquinoline quinone (PQQ) biosynthesis protein C
MAMDALHSLCIQLSARKLLIAVTGGRSWLTCFDTSKVVSLPVSALAAKRLTLAASVIEGAVMAGLEQTDRAVTNASLTLARYVRWLVGNYVFARQTPILFRQAGERFRSSSFFRRDLAEFALKKAEEEDGHADLAYRDLEALGLPAAQVIRLIQPPSASAFAERFRTYVESSEPIMLFGFSYCLERMAAERGEAFIKKIQSICPQRVCAIRFLNVHSNMGSDSAHVDEQLSFFESMTTAEVSGIARGAFETATMLARQSLMDQSLTDAEIGLRLELVGIKLPEADQDITRLSTPP